MVSWSSYQRWWFWYHWQHNRWCYRQLLGGWLGAKLNFSVVGGFSVQCGYRCFRSGGIVICCQFNKKDLESNKLIYALA
jgi:hypothetical protein